jgi:hypothetical protein
MSAWYNIIIELDNRFKRLKGKIKTDNLIFSKKFTLENITCHTIFIDICFKDIDNETPNETYGFINGFNICLFEINAPPFINYESSSIKKSLEKTNRPPYAQNIQIQELKLEKTKLETEKTKLETEKTKLETEKEQLEKDIIKQLEQQIQQQQKLQELEEKLKQTQAEKLTLSDDKLQTEKELTEAQTAQAVQTTKLQQELEAKTILLLEIKKELTAAQTAQEAKTKLLLEINKDLGEAHEKQKELLAQIREVKAKAIDEDEEEEKEEKFRSLLMSDAELWLTEVEPHLETLKRQKSELLVNKEDMKELEVPVYNENIQEGLNELSWNKKYLKKGKETEQKYFTYKNKFNQSKYYDKYLKYKLKYNQLKEKI